MTPKEDVLYANNYEDKFPCGIAQPWGYGLSKSDPAWPRLKSSSRELHAIVSNSVSLRIGSECGGGDNPPPGDGIGLHYYDCVASTSPSTRSANQPTNAAEASLLVPLYLQFPMSTNGAQ
jgi:hypothetical protein